MYYDTVENNNIWWAYIKDGKVDPFSHRTSIDDIYIERSCKVSRKVNDLRSEMEYAAIDICNKNDDVTILYSGGLDSEMIVRTFHGLGLKFNVKIFKFGNDINKHDTDYAINTCEELGIKPDIETVDVVKWLENDLQEYASPLRSASPQIALHYYMIDNTPGFVIMGEGRISPRRCGAHYDMETYTHKPVYFMESCGEKWGVSQWFKYRNRSGSPKFYRYTPELEYAYANDPTTQDWINGMSVDMKLRNFKFVKTSMFQKYFPEIRYKTKYTGFETIMDLDKIYRDELAVMYPSSNSFVSYDFNTFLDIKSGKVEINTIRYVPLTEVYNDKDILNDFRYETDMGTHVVGVV